MSNSVDVMNLPPAFFPFHFSPFLCCATLFLCRYLKSMSGLFGMLRTSSTFLVPSETILGKREISTSCLLTRCHTYITVSINLKLHFTPERASPTTACCQITSTDICRVALHIQPSANVVFPLIFYCSKAIYRNTISPPLLHTNILL